MTKLELYVKFTNGTGKVIATGRDTFDNREGRDYLDRIAWRLMASDKVRYATIKSVERTANTTGKGRYR